MQGVEEGGAVKNKPMKPVKEWAVIDADGNLIYEYRTREEARKDCSPGHGERIARVEIREVSRAPKGN